MTSESRRPSLAVLKRQFAVCIAFVLILTTVVVSLYVQDRQREWALRSEQARHRLGVATELFAREFERVGTDALFLANQTTAKRFLQGDADARAPLEAEYKNFIRSKNTYDQIRLLNMDGREIVRVNYAAGQVATIAPDRLQNKADRYYFREARSLACREVFVSEFDLNLEYGEIENPLKPVIRFVTPVCDPSGVGQGLLVLNYLGARLLDELDDNSQPGKTLLIRPDGNYLRGPTKEDAWGWLLNHERTFDAQFAQAWQRVNAGERDCFLTHEGAFAVGALPVGRRSSVRHTADVVLDKTSRDAMLVISYLPIEDVFAASHQLLRRLLLLSACVIPLLCALSWFWAQASVNRHRNLQTIAESEERMRTLSSRLLRIQEEERRAISREIHDELGQQVTAINLDMKLARRSLGDEEAAKQLDRAIKENDELLQTLHAFARRVRPAVLDDLGLHDAIASHLREFEDRTQIPVVSALDFQSEAVPHDVADNAYRMIQESLNNVVKHAEASRVFVSVRVENDEPNRRMLLIIRDNGRGYRDSKRDNERLGLVGMQERVDLLGGALRIDSQAEQGTTITISLPLAPADRTPIFTQDPS